MWPGSGHIEAHGPDMLGLPQMAGGVICLWRSIFARNVNNRLDHTMPFHRKRSVDPGSHSQQSATVLFCALRNLVMKMRSCLSFILLFTSPVAMASAPASTDAALEARVDALFEPWNHSDSPGLALAVIRDGKVEYKKGYGMASLELGTAITPHTVFYIASVSKQFTAASIALLVERGSVSLDDDVRKYVPELPDYGQRITIDNLIHHTSGLRDYLVLARLSGRDAANVFPEQAAIDMIVRQKGLNFSPGSKYLYSNSNYLLLSLIVNRVTGKSMRMFADETIFRPLGMNQTQYYDDPTEIVPNRTIGHTVGTDGRFHQYRTSFALTGDGGVLSSVEDLAKWDLNFYDNKLGNGGQALIDRLQTRGLLNDGKKIDYAFGLMVSSYRGLPIVKHAGIFLASRGNMLRFPEQKLSVIILSNLEAVDPVQLSEAVADIYLEGRFPEKGGPPPAQKAGGDCQSLAPAQLAAFAGNYYSPELDTHYILATGAKGLTVQRSYMDPINLTMCAKGFASGPFKLQFTNDGRGKLNGFILDAGQASGLRFARVGK